jgi:hypothetical protein
MKTYIYLIENCFGDSNKIYIGKTITPEIRKQVHKKSYGNDITFIIIDEIDSLNKKDWKPLECYWIEQFRQWGFDILNKNKGGSGLSFLTEEQRINLRVPKKYKQNFSYPKSEEQKQKISKSKTGHACYESIERNKKISQSLKGYKQTQDHIEKRSAHLKGKSNLKNKKPKPEGFGNIISNKLKGRQHVSIQKQVLQYDLEANFIREWPSITEACKILFNDVSKNPNITKCCQNKIKSAYGFIWKYKE